MIRRPSWHEIRFNMARDLSVRSLCVRDRVGAIIVDIDNKVIGEGYNGPPRGFWHYQKPCTAWCQRTVNAKLIGEDEARVTLNHNQEVVVGLHPEYYDCPALHAEANALMMSDRTLRISGTIYVTSHVCMNCAKLIANSGLAHVVVATDNDAKHRNAFASYEFMTRCGLKVHINGKQVLVS